MDKQAILRKIASLRRCIERIEEKVPETSEKLQSNYDSQDIISLNLQRAVQVCVDIASHLNAQSSAKAPESMAESFDNLNQMGILSDKICDRMKKSVGFRNIAVHEYSTINWDIVFSVSTTNLGDFKEFAKEIIAWMDKN
ncbi:MAG: DUF86 domain-containing protein [Proteobacteria bacterium]|nr:DUF86 domain-containing protein [Pseudomonadota bacterium]MBU1388715.1 DUF86 domain-containing protein [Pseudomonadota bacterium]MBU1543056.1 DUF86 domain-containing protein [Pseudomonadota bacterium]MBU2482822.1 DUF86 domain-containing protein [Pseudomonadota bacterium]